MTLSNMLNYNIRSVKTTFILSWKEYNRTGINIDNFNIDNILNNTEI